MSIYFCNEEAIDLDVIRIMGVSVKTNDSPIGYFGTGLKFAIATLLRNGQTIKLTRNGRVHPIVAETRKVRGEAFDVVTLDGTDLGFTTQLGRNWEVWMAYREIYSNCLDEGGEVAAEMPDGDFGTIIELEGDLVMAVHEARDTIFLTDSAKLAHKIGVASLHKGANPYAFYRGVRALTHERPALFTWNVTDSCQLTEDRTMASPYRLMRAAVDLVLGLDNEGLLEAILLAPDHSFESQLNFESYASVEPSAAFMRVCDRHRTNLSFNPTAGALWRSKQSYTVLYEPVELSKMNEREIDEAMELLKILDCTLTRDEFIVVESLGGAFYGVYRDGFILIDRKTLEKGPRFIAGTLYEEWIHKAHHLRDCTRELQNMLLDKLIYFVDRTRAAEK